jgi:hypothetical protein
MIRSISDPNEPTAFQKENVDIEIRHGTGGWPGLFVEGLVEESTGSGSPARSASSSSGSPGCAASPP